MSWRLAAHSSKVVFSYWIPCAVKTFRDAIFTEDVIAVVNLAMERPKLLHQAVDADGNTALGLAIQLGRVKVVKLLLKLGSDANVANVFDGNHPLFLLAKSLSHGKSKITIMATLLLDAGSNPLSHVRHQPNKSNRFHPSRTPAINETPLLYCVRVQNEDLLKIYIAHDVDINAYHKETFISPLMLAASLGYERFCKLLLEAGADVNASDLEGNTALHLAVQHWNVIQILLDYGADANALNDEGYTPLMLIQRRKRT